MTPTRPTHRSRSLALSSLNRIRTISLLHQAQHPVITPPGSQERNSKGFGRLIPGRGRKEAVKVKLTLNGENIWLVRGEIRRKGVVSTVVEESEETDASIQRAITQAFEEMESPLSTLSQTPLDSEDAVSSDVECEKEGLGQVEEEDDWEVLDGVDVEGDKGKIENQKEGRRWGMRLY